MNWGNWPGIAIPGAGAPPGIIWFGALGRVWTSRLYRALLSASGSLARNASTAFHRPSVTSRWKVFNSSSNGSGLAGVVVAAGVAAAPGGAMVARFGRAGVVGLGSSMPDQALRIDEGRRSNVS